MGEYYEIRGKKIYVEVLGDSQKMALLFIHGGPGGIGCEDFVKFAGNKLAENFRVVAVDQRGVWRSEELKDDEKITLEDIIEDFEELRRQLKIEKWSLLSHSFGGYISVLYADLYPDSIEKIIYENPSFDFSLSERYMLQNAAMELIKSGKKHIGQIYLKLMYQATNHKDTSKLLNKALAALGTDGSKIMWFGDNRSIIERIDVQKNKVKELVNKSNKTRVKLLSDLRIYNNVFDKLSKIDKPSLLIKGKCDPITSKKQIKEFLFDEVEGNMAERKVVRFDYSGHWARIEENEKYCNVVTDFILSKN
ncbi:alpha/beta hydrolase [Clostridium sp. SM-530-WT-3G]|uniref:alpha/beta fold hydrolase n=1 Tax=Clostridium sp. SM-530-WT-3G TaxID=2725303 RepID=UPI00145E016E|nr:alpha/beta hydrolase [Clostridium sp. SM-530-WT-3G]NME81904.1 alpha/beta hydrolase [Clostridium sp. SM-530-WT-3G]